MSESGEPRQRTKRQSGGAQRKEKAANGRPLDTRSKNATNVAVALNRARTHH